MVTSRRPLYGYIGVKRRRKKIVVPGYMGWNLLIDWDNKSMSGVQGKISRFLGQILRRTDAILTLDIKWAVLDVTSIADIGLKIELLKSVGSFGHISYIVHTKGDGSFFTTIIYADYGLGLVNNTMTCCTNMLKIILIQIYVFNSVWLREFLSHRLVTCRFLNRCQ
jgi:hypothetical protein